MELFTGKPSPETLDYLLKRRSVKAADMTGPGPNDEQLQTILTAATRVPDHGMLCPWYFIVLQGDARAEAGDILAEAYKAENPECSEDNIEAERNRFTRAPVVVAVVSRARMGKPPLWEQILSAGAACQNLVTAANASGFCVQWLTEWYGYNDDVRTGFGLEQGDNFAGFIYIGTPKDDEQTERARPDLKELVTYWGKDRKLNKGDVYNRTKFDFPDLGVTLKKA